MPIWRKEGGGLGRIEKDSDGDWCFLNNLGSLMYYVTSFKEVDHPKED
jgi:hypothetical protein